MAANSNFQFCPILNPIRSFDIQSTTLKYLEKKSFADLIPTHQTVLMHHMMRIEGCLSCKAHDTSQPHLATSGGGVTHGGKRYPPTSIYICSQKAMIG